MLIPRNRLADAYERAVQANERNRTEYRDLVLLDLNHARLMTHDVDPGIKAAAWYQIDLLLDRMNIVGWAALELSSSPFSGVIPCE